ncbi:ABC transporter permease [Aliiglaciecola sp. LCG003]|uniref:ABC transporter permease n=1 Tax=Aliiglaciecola sp. LCG003 TaxID=3053655 RepID=UPI002572C688|nr:ABC transporter permease [Aliiglaciecola sp. LCG003]WJG11316.1 ABC transporter permease [Aliiglaciecola sp. LCG003]
MFAHIIRKFNLLFFTLLVLSLFSFLLVYMFPGDPLINLTGLKNIDSAQYEQLAIKHGFDRSYLHQYWYYLLNIFDGQIGLSFSSGLPLWDEISQTFPASIELCAYALILSLLIGVPMGFLAGFQHYKPIDFGLLTASVLGYSMPIFWLSLILILIFSLQLGWLPLSGRISLLFDIPHKTGFILLDLFFSDIEFKSDAINSAVKHLIMPTLSLTIVTTAIIFRLTRRSVIDVMTSQYIQAAYTRGLSHFQVIMRHGVRNALLPIIPLFAMQFAVLLTNAMIIEVIFSWPGIGNWLIQAIYQQDYPAIRAGMLAVSTLVIAFTVTVDLVAKLINPAQTGARYAKV